MVPPTALGVRFGEIWVQTDLSASSRLGKAIFFLSLTFFISKIKRQVAPKSFPNPLLPTEPHHQRPNCALTLSLINTNNSMEIK